MKTSQMIFLGLALFLTVEYSTASHLPNCGLGPGNDACGCSKFIVKAAKPAKPLKYADPYVIREAAAYRHAPVHHGCGSANPPRPIYGPSVTDLLKTSGPVAPRFRPVGDLCSCKTTVADVVPAYVPKPVCNTCAQKAAACEAGYADPYFYGNAHYNPAQLPSYNVAAAAASAAAAKAELNALEEECLSFDEQESIYNQHPVPAAPADPVSLSLAYGLAQKTIKIVPESGLAFGPRTTPIDGSIRKVAVNIPEERLFTVDKPVVELKLTPKYAVSATYNEVLAQQEALEEQRLALEAAQDPGQGLNSFISFSDLGYGPVASTGNAFLNTVSADPATEVIEDSGCGPVGKPLPGYISGNVIVRTAPEPQHEVDPADYYSDGSYEYDGDADAYDSYSNESPAPCDGGNSFLDRLKASVLPPPPLHPAGCGCGCGK